jgi:hypothetical protein
LTGRNDRFLASADKKLVSARKILAFDEEACLQQAYEAMLKASLGFMFSHGFRARSQPGHHIAIIDFVRSRIDKKHAGLLVVFDRLRRKRNTALYDDTGFVSAQSWEPAGQIDSLEPSACRHRGRRPIAPFSLSGVRPDLVYCSTRRDARQLQNSTVQPFSPGLLERRRLSGQP